MSFASKNREIIIDFNNLSTKPFPKKIFQSWLLSAQCTSLKKRRENTYLGIQRGRWRENQFLTLVLSDSQPDNIFMIIDQQFNQKINLETKIKMTLHFFTYHLNCTIWQTNRSEIR